MQTLGGVANGNIAHAHAQNRSRMAQKGHQARARASQHIQSVDDHADGARARATHAVNDPSEKRTQESAPMAAAQPHPPCEHHARAPQLGGRELRPSRAGAAASPSTSAHDCTKHTAPEAAAHSACAPRQAQAHGDRAASKAQPESLRKSCRLEGGGRHTATLHSASTTISRQRTDQSAACIGSGVDGGRTGLHDLVMRTRRSSKEKRRSSKRVCVSRTGNRGEIRSEACMYYYSSSVTHVCLKCGRASGLCVRARAGACVRARERTTVRM